MKQFLISFFIIVNQSTSGLVINPSTDVRRVISGSFMEKIQDWKKKYEPTPRGEEEEEPIRFKSFESLLAMIVFSKDVNEQDAVGNNLNEQKQYESYKTEMSRLEDKYTNYGCYCYNSGVDNGIHGGGVPRDPIDRHCKELYQCYKCLAIDFNATHNDMAGMEYNVNLSMKNGQKSMECEDSFDMTAGCPRNLCECDKKFAMAIAKVDDGCDSNGDGCPSNEFYTKTATQSPFEPKVNPGKFVVHQSCQSNNPHEANENCCGVYPDRQPYNPETKECCEVNTFYDLLNYKTEEIVVNKGVSCADKGGEYIPPDHMVHNHAHDTVMGTNSLVLGRSLLRKFTDLLE